MKKNKVLYWVFQGLGFALMLFFSIMLLVDQYGSGLKGEFFAHIRVWLFVSLLYTICVLLYKELFGVKK